MSLSSLYLDAFYAVVQNGSFTNASKALAITQSALSQRVLNLENELG
ncbi:MAG: LysR family transcriptional regulator, partial [Bacteriovoracaceae bacterium]|nr:LysR family transcriptional regulator [Bacteriovoracaceae bacterium]